MTGSAPKKQEPPRRSGWKDRFVETGRVCSEAMGSPWTFGLALLIVGLWAVSGPLFDYSDTWQLVINTGTTVVTFLMVFLIQSTQNRDSRAIQLKLDELIRAVHGARNRLVDLEDLSEEELKKISAEFERLRKRSEKKGKSRKPDADRQD